jgi:predicted transcriptional regulator
MKRYDPLINPENLRIAAELRQYGITRKMIKQTLGVSEKRIGKYLKSPFAIPDPLRQELLTMIRIKQLIEEDDIDRRFLKW